MSRRQLSSLCLLPLALGACSDRPVHDVRTEPALVRVAAVQPGSATTRAFTGVVAARVQSDLGFRVAGKVLERTVDAGQAVRRGQALMRIDSVDLALQARAQQEAVAAAKARARQTADDEARYRGLVGDGAVAASAYDQIKAAADAASAQLKAAQAQADVATNASAYAVLVADADGVVVETLAEPGQVVAAGQVVVRLARAGQREALVHLPETLRPAVGSLVQARLYGSTEAAAPARLRQLSDAADRTTRTFEARYVLEGALARAPLGSTVTIDVQPGTQGGPSLQVPIGALFDPGHGPGVWIAEGNPATLAWRSVQVLGLAGESAQVAGDLKVGEPIVALGAHLLRAGELVRTVAEGGPGPRGGRP
ncbi:efflux RND transporter periplasmic adaptor subunit [Pseudorhodoferax sp. Leaf265]|uniref:efflux RND transporter periplasmic adaptor subunit n=1 Tax=Pseudorhodoferax sp. Leaf265 TaxID=1736315 RepID=UPI0006FDF118|nr:efflux RND transporter periplasmic adaptor subunit [Pseudorhodoferax sp. Leaf265]KQP17126.1 hemolysin secretion protein D [Pseudorhodoferax sp. Leaf265]